MRCLLDVADALHQRSHGFGVRLHEALELRRVLVHEGGARRGQRLLGPCVFLTRPWRPGAACSPPRVARRAGTNRPDHCE